MLYNHELQRQQQHRQQSSSPSLSGRNALDSFIYALKSSEAQRQYPVRLRLFFNFIGLPGTLEEQAESFAEKSKGLGGQWTQDSIINFVNHHKQRVMRKELATGTLNNYYMAVKLFCEMNDLATSINWKRISRGLPRMKVAANDRAPTIEEIRKLVEYPDRRIKAIVYCMASGGFRLGSWQYLRWKHVTPITDNEKGEIIAAKLIIYAEEPEQYYTFISPESYNALKGWMDFRESYGEKITGESWVMRDLWQTSNVKYGAKWGLATNPKKLQTAAIKKILNRALWVQGLRRPLTEGKRRHEFKSAHGLRKFFKTRAEQVMRPLNVELLLSHDSGISEYYYRPVEREVLEDYLKAVDLLTINDNNNGNSKLILQKQQKMLLEQAEEKEKAAKEAEEQKKRIDEMAQEIKDINARFTKSQSEWVDYWLREADRAKARGENPDELLPWE